MAFNFKNISVLLVEDDPVMRELLFTILRRLEICKVEKANEGQTALNMLQQADYDVIITDWQMSPVDGISMTKSIRRQEVQTPNRAVPIILLTGYADVKSAAKARDSGVSELLLKPFSVDDIAKRLAYILTHPRDFIDIPSYQGPDRRRIKKAGYEGPYRRDSDKQTNQQTG